MSTYPIGTGGMATSEVIADHLEGEVEAGDHLEVVTVPTSDDPGEKTAGEEALAHVEERSEGAEVSVSSHRFSRDRSRAEESVHHADEVATDHVLTGLRRHSRTERIIFGSVSQRLLQRVTRPISLVALPEYQAPAE